MGTWANHCTSSGLIFSICEMGGLGWPDGVVWPAGLLVCPPNPASLSVYDHPARCPGGNLQVVVELPQSPQIQAAHLSLIFCFYLTSTFPAASQPPPPLPRMVVTVSFLLTPGPFYPFSTQRGIFAKCKINQSLGVPVVAQWLMNPTRNHEVSGLIPGFAQWVKDLALP